MKKVLKKCLIILFIIILLIFAGNFIFDHAYQKPDSVDYDKCGVFGNTEDLFSDSELKELNELIKKTSEKSNITILFYAADNYEKEKSDTLDLVNGVSSPDILYYIIDRSKVNNDSLLTTGKVKEHFSDSQTVFNAFAGESPNNDYGKNIRSLCGFLENEFMPKYISIKSVLGQFGITSSIWVVLIAGIICLGIGIGLLNDEYRLGIIFFIVPFFIAIILLVCLVENIGLWYCYLHNALINAGYLNGEYMTYKNIDTIFVTVVSIILMAVFTVYILIKVYKLKQKLKAEEHLKDIQIALISSDNTKVPLNIFRAGFIYDFLEHQVHDIGVYDFPENPKETNSKEQYEKIKNYMENSAVFSNDFSYFEVEFRCKKFFIKKKYTLDVYTYCGLPENSDITDLKKCMDTGLFLIISNESPNIENIVFQLVDKMPLIYTSSGKYKVPLMIMVNKNIFSSPLEDGINKLQANNSIFADREKAVDFLCRGTLSEICVENINALNLLDNNFENLHLFVYSDEPTETIHTAVFKSLIVSQREFLYDVWKVKKGSLPETLGSYSDFWRDNKGDFTNWLK